MKKNVRVCGVAPRRPSSRAVVAFFERYPDFYITVSVYRAVDCRSTCVWILNSRSMGARGGKGGLFPLQKYVYGNFYNLPLILDKIVNVVSIAFFYITLDL